MAGVFAVQVQVLLGAGAIAVQILKVLGVGKILNRHVPV
jgi:hypothetical protein